MDKIKFILENIPDNVYNKSEESNIYKILNPIANQLDNFILKLDEVKNSKFIDYAVGDNLDKLASILNLKRYVNENDDLFRSRVKSRVPTFIGGGAIKAIKQVINNYLGVEPIIIEHYKTGESHPYFDKGVLNGFKASVVSGLNFKIYAGTAYIDGNRIITNDVELTAPPSTTNYVKLNSNGSFVMESNSTVSSTQVLLTKVDSGVDSINLFTNMSTTLNPEQHYITNTASITVQIPFNFNIGNVSLDDVKNILRNTKAAGIALLIKIMDTYEDYIRITDSCHSFFLMGFSGISSNNVLGGR